MKDENKILKFEDFDNIEQNEAMYKQDDDGNMVKQEYEFYSDVYPEKFRYSVSSNNTEELYNECEGVWVLKQNDEIIATFSGKLSEELVRSAVEHLKNNSEENEIGQPNNDI